MFYTNEEVETILERLPQTLNPDDRIKLYHRLLDLTSQDAPFVSLFSLPRIIVMRRGVDGLFVDIRAGYHFEGVTLAE